MSYTYYMLGQLFGSNARVQILKLFLFNPEEKYYIRQLARRLKLQVNSVRRELDNLEKFGILVSGANIDAEEIGGDYSTVETQNLASLQCGKSPYAEATKDKPAHAKASADKPAYAKASADKQEKKYYKANAGFILFDEIKSLIIKAQILYGRDFIDKLKNAGNVKLLIMTGKFVNEPDFSVDLLIVGRFNKIKLLRLIKELEGELGREVNFTVMDTKEFKYRRDITDVFLYNILEGKNIIAVDEM